MAKDDDKDKGNGSTPEEDLKKATREIDTLKGQIKELKKHEEASGQLARIIADPDVRDMLIAKERGDEVRVIVGDDNDDKGGDKGGDKDFDEMTRKELVEFMVDASSKAAANVFEERSRPITESLETLVRDRNSIKESDVRKEMAEVKKKFSDFDKFKTEIADLQEENPTLRVEELYHLARLRKGVDITKKVAPETEKPSSTSAVPSGKRERDKPIPPTTKGFQQLIDEHQAKTPDEDE